MQRPLADEIRPKTLDQVVGQRHILAPGAVLRRLIESGADANMVFYGPSGGGGAGGSAGAGDPAGTQPSAPGMGGGGSPAHCHRLRR